MNRRGFIRSALAATVGVAAGAMMPSVPVEKVVEIVKDPFRDGFIFREIKFIIDDDCPEDVIYFLPADFKWKVRK